MNEYETIFITGDNLTNEQRKCVLDKVLTCINENGKIDSIEEMGLKKLAYTIKKSLSLLTPYFVIISITWILLVVGWYITGLPIGVGVYPTL